MSNIAQGYSLGLASKRYQDEREERRQAAELKRQQFKVDLAKQGYYFDDKGNVQREEGGAAQLSFEKSQQELEALRDENIMIQKNAATARVQQSMFAADASGDSTDMQLAINNDPMVREAMGSIGVQVVDNISFDDPNDKAMLYQGQIIPAEFDNLSKETQDLIKDAVNSNQFKMFDGSNWRIGDMEGSMTMLGADNTATSAQRQQRIANKKKTRLASDAYIREMQARDAELEEAKGRFDTRRDIERQKVLSSKGTTAEMEERRLAREERQTNTYARAQDIAEASLGVKAAKQETAEQAEARRAEKQEADLAYREAGGAKGQKQSITRQKEEQVYEAVGGKEKFDTMTSSQIRNNSEAKRLINEALDLRGIKFNTADRKRQASLNETAGVLANSAVKLTEKNTGIFDSNFDKGWRTWIGTADPDSAEAKQAYDEVKALFIKERAGSAATPQEMERVDAALGAIGNDLVSVLTGIRLMLGNAKYNIEADINSIPFEPAVKMIYGDSIEAINTTDRALHERLNEYRVAKGRNPVPYEGESVSTPIQEKPEAPKIPTGKWAKFNSQAR